MKQPPAFASLVLAHQHTVHAVLARVLFRGSLADVDDLAQEAFLRVHRALPELDDRGPEPMRKWIITIAVRVAIDHLRRTRPTVTFDEDLHRLPAPAVDELAAHRRLGVDLEAALAELGGEQRAILVMRDLLGFEYQEIADALAIELGTVKSRLHRARACVRGRLRKEQHG